MASRLASWLLALLHCRYSAWKDKANCVTTGPRPARVPSPLQTRILLSLAWKSFAIRPLTTSHLNATQMLLTLPHPPTPKSFQFWSQQASSLLSFGLSLLLPPFVQFPFVPHWSLQSPPMTDLLGPSHLWCYLKPQLPASHSRLCSPLQSGSTGRQGARFSVLCFSLVCG